MEPSKTLLWLAVAAAVFHLFFRFDRRFVDGYQFEYDRLTGAARYVPMQPGMPQGQFLAGGSTPQTMVMQGSSPPSSAWQWQEGRGGSTQGQAASPVLPATSQSGLRPSGLALVNSPTSQTRSGVPLGAPVVAPVPSGVPEEALRKDPLTLGTMLKSVKFVMPDNTPAPPLPLSRGLPATSEAPSQPPLPTAPFASKASLLATGEGGKSFASSSAVAATQLSQGRIDLNQDGRAEEVLRYNRQRPDGLMDYSILTVGQRELFYARGRQVRRLTTKHYGWPDLAVEVSPGYRLIYVYQPDVQGYEMVGPG